ncbi:putative biosynthetic protein (TIGR04099 family) [Ancylobacter aquaticus]|uniref:Putative biosynthetic protein (TIGR04099 family) n=1 Tax=Ancylobacter aquaticus TaxID=100 RepID=A0A4R1HM11_ANCAQ|nr:Pnap_2097 family protein [Ancylobacter aquaticus]TCK23507.1 putative biosynthetic protein (TIGR04099 family) [Ancylobacter aquaticus]
MNLALPPGTFLAPAVPVAEDRVQLGMPQLCLGGLSETWLLKELGHRHWMALAAMAGRAVPDFHDADGAPVYAAFSALSVEDADFASLGANDWLTIRSDIRRISRTQCASRHDLTCGGRTVGTVHLVSAFVRRALGGGNHTVARVALEGFPAPARAGGGRREPELAARAAAFRAGRATGDARLGFGLSRGQEATLEIDPCPAQDFNGAGFLYFTSFLAFIDRAEWHFDGRRAPRATTRSREVYFHGNIDPGERVVVRRLKSGREAGQLVHHCRLERAGDGTRLADAFTRRVL